MITTTPAVRINEHKCTDMRIHFGLKFASYFIPKFEWSNWKTWGTIYIEETKIAAKGEMLHHSQLMVCKNGRYS